MQEGGIKFYHRTFSSDAILREGFKDAEGYFLTASLHKGVWGSDIPLDANQGAEGDIVLCIELPEKVIADYEWIEEGKPHREFLAPAKLLNKYGPPKIVERDAPKHPLLRKMLKQT